MKLPRWLVIAMLTTSVLAVLAAAGWWWVTWPERTAREFVALIREGHLEQANRILTPGNTSPFLTDSMRKRVRCEVIPQTWLEVIIGRQKFWFFDGDWPLIPQFEVERGKVRRADPFARGKLVLDVDGDGDLDILVSDLPASP